MKKMAAVATAILVATGMAAMAQTKNGIVILIKDVETPTTRAATGKYIDVKKAAVAHEASILTEEDRTTLDPVKLTDIRGREVDDRIRLRQEERDAVKRQNEKQEATADMLRNNAMGTQEGRNIIQARDWMAAAVMPFSSLIQVIDRSEQATAMDESARSGDAQTMRGGVTHYMRIIVGDVKETKTSTQAYGAKTELVKKVLNVSVSVNDLNDRQVYVGSFNGESSRVYTSHGNTSGGDDHEEMLQSALKQAGEAIGSHFTGRLTVDVQGPREEGDAFNPSLVTVLVDDMMIAPGQELLLLKGAHKVEVQSEDYMPWSRTINLASDMPLKIPMISAYGYTRFTAPAGVDANSLSLELATTDGSGETLYGEGPHKIKKGKYTLKATIDGFMPYENKSFSVGGGTEEKPMAFSVALRPVPTPQQ